VLEATTEAIVMFDLSGRLLLTNSAMDRFMDLVGIPKGVRLLELAARVRVNTVDPQAYWKVVAAAADNPEFEAFSGFELMESGQAFDSYTAPVREADGQIIGRLFAIRDVTEQRDADRLKSELVTTVSHELRTPLASILGYAELMVARGGDADTFLRYAQTIHRQADRLTDLINEFLDLQRIEAGSLPMAFEGFELTELLAEQVELFSGQSEGHQLVLRSDDGGGRVHADRERTAQVVGNLLSNAIKYSPGGGPVEVVLTQRDGSARVEVTDHGIGIPDDQQRRIFTKFFRVDSSDTRAIGGTGLGLAFSRELVQAQGGRIGFESTVGSGSTFWFELPAAGAAELSRAV
jgi:two-component system, OmpR family, sensor histidine kinase VicK